MAGAGGAALGGSSGLNGTGAKSWRVRRTRGSPWHPESPPGPSCVSPAPPQPLRVSPPGPPCVPPEPRISPPTPASPRLLPCVSPRNPASPPRPPHVPPTTSTFGYLGARGKRLPAAWQQDTRDKRVTGSPAYHWARRQHCHRSGSPASVPQPCRAACF